MAFDTIKLKRGLKSKLSKLSYGEPAYISDENELYIGTEDGVEKITRNKEVAELSSQLEQIKNKVYLKSFKRLDSETDDTQRFKRAIDTIKSNGAKLIIEDNEIIISSSIECDYYINIEGTNSGFLNLWEGVKTFPKIKYTGTGKFLNINGRNIDNTKNAISGITFKNIWIEGNDSAYCGISVNDDGMGTATTTRGIILDNVQISGFTRGYAYRINNAYGIKFINCAFQVNAVNGFLYRCYAVDYISCTKEDSLVNVYVKQCPQVNFIGGVNEGTYVNSSRYVMPSDFPVWNGWQVGTGETDTITHIRNTHKDYEGTGIVNFGSSIYCNQLYFESNMHHVICELESFTVINNSTIECVDSKKNKTFVNIANGRVMINNCLITGGSFAEGFIYTDRGYIDQITINDIYSVVAIDDFIKGHTNYNYCKSYKSDLTTKSLESKEINTDILIKKFANDITVSGGNVGGVTINSLSSYYYIDVINGSLNINESSNYPLKEGQEVNIIVKTTNNSTTITPNASFINSSSTISIDANSVKIIKCVKHNGKIICTF